MQADELSVAHDGVKHLKEQTAALARDLERTRVMRNRVLSWRQQRLNTAFSVMQRLELFLAWKSLAVESNRRRLQAAIAEANSAQRKLRERGTELLAQCLAVKQELLAGRTSWQQQADALRQLQSEIRTKSVTTMLALTQQVYDRCEMAVSDAQGRVLATERMTTVRKQQWRANERVLVQLIAHKRSQATRSRAFHVRGNWLKVAGCARD